LPRERSLSSTSFDLKALLPLYLPQLPLLLVWLAGILVALFTLRRHPRTSALVLIAMFLLIGQSVFGTFAWHWLTTSYSRAGTTQQELATQLMALNLARAGFTTAAWALVLVAVFSGRQPHYPRFIPEDEPEPVRRAAPRRPPVDLPPGAIREPPPPS
jgi:hypothetical protein